MARYQAYECEVCAGRFRYFHHPNDSPPPDKCPLCGAVFDGHSVFEALAPSIKGVAAAAGDQVYNAMEAASEHRTHMMAELGGGSASNYNHTKITDLNDRQREGDTAYKMSANAVSGFMASNPTAAIGSQHASVAQQYAAEAHTGYFPHAGSRTSDVVKNVHNSLVGKMQRQGQMNRGGE